MGERDERGAEESGMTMIVKTVARFITSFILVFGIYIIVYGHLTPGGGFSGGVIVAAAYILLVLAFGKGVALGRFSDFAASLLDNIGALGFLAIGLTGIAGGYFFLNIFGHGRPFQLMSAGTIPLANIAIGLKVAASLYAIFVALAVFGRIVADERDRHDTEDR